MTQFIQIDVDIDYPVGEHIVKNVIEIDKMAKALVECYPARDMTFWVTGSSGSIIAAIICSKLRCNTKIIYVKKPKEDNHHIDEHPQPIKDSLNIIVDDFTRSFSTIQRVLKAVQADGFKPDCLCLGGSLWGHKMELDVNTFPVIIASRIYIPGYTIEESGMVSIEKSVEEYIIDKLKDSI